MDYDTRNWQYEFTVLIYHGQNFGHYIEIEERWKGRNTVRRIGGGQWKGLGVPEDVLNSLLALVHATLTEHLLTRYGVAGELPLKWSGEPDPF